MEAKDLKAKLSKQKNHSTGGKEKGYELNYSMRLGSENLQQKTLYWRKTNQLQTQSTLHGWAVKLMKQKITPTEANKMPINLTHLQTELRKLPAKKKKNLSSKRKKGFRNTNVAWDKTRAARLAEAHD